MGNASASAHHTLQQPQGATYTVLYTQGSMVCLYYETAKEAWGGIKVVLARTDSA